MGAFGSCLGVDRPMKSDNSHFLPSNLISINANLFGSASGYKYNRQTDEDFDLCMNDQLETTDNYTISDWPSSRSEFKRKPATKSKHRSEIDELKASGWYFGLVTRKQAEARLRASGGTDGSFMIRNSETGGPGQLTLSIKHGNVVKHYRIICDKKQNQFFINKRKPFGSITDLVIHYKKAADGLCTKLSEPCQDSFKCVACKHRQRPPSLDSPVTKKAKLLIELEHVKSGDVYEGQLRANRQFADSHHYVQDLTRCILSGTKNLFFKSK